LVHCISPFGLNRTTKPQNNKRCSKFILDTSRGPNGSGSAARTEEVAIDMTNPKTTQLNFE
jgi:hypothetical protein